MFDLIGPIGAVKTQTGQLVFGNLGTTDCVFFRLETTAKAVPCVIYTADELKHLIELVEQAITLQQTTSPGTILRLGSMAPKPISFKIALVHPHQGAPFLLLRLLQDPWKEDITTPAESFLALLKMGVSPGSRPLIGPLNRNPDKSWRIAGKRLEIVEGLSPGRGYYGEYLHPDEVAQGEELEVWPVTVDGKELVGTFRTRERWKPAGKVTERKGQEGDLALAKGHTHKCRQIHLARGREMMASGHIDMAWAAKFALSSLLCDIEDGENESGHATWLGRSPEPLLQLGIKSMEAGQTSIEDLMLYQQVACYFHALGTNPSKAAAAVDGIMEKVFEALEDRRQRRLALNNWYMFLKEIHEGHPDQIALKAWTKAKARYPGTVVPKALSFRPPHPWVVDWTDEKPKLIGASKPKAEVGEKKKFSIVTGCLLCVAVLFVAIGLSALFSKPPANIVHNPNRAKAKKTAAAKAPPKRARPLINLSKVTIAGLDPKERYLVDRQIPGWKMFDAGEGWSRHKKDGVELLLGSTGRKGMYRASGFSSTALFAGGKRVFSIEDDPALLSPDSLKALRTARIEMEKDLTTKRLTAFTKGSFPPGAPKVGQPQASFLFKYCREGDLSAFQGLLSKENVNLQFTDGHLLLSKIAAIPNSSKFIKAMLKADANVKADGQAAFWATQDPETVLLLAKAGVNVDSHNPRYSASSRRTRLFGAGPAMAKALIKAGADPNYLDSQGGNALLRAKKGTVKVLLEAGADAKVVDSQGYTTLHYAADGEAVSLLLKAGANPNLKSKKGRAPIDTRDYGILIALLKGGADPNLRFGKYDQTALFNRFKGKDIAAKRALLKAGADPNIQNSEGRTVLLYTHDPETTKLLLKAGADPTIKNKKGQSPLSQAYGERKKLLEKYAK